MIASPGDDQDIRPAVDELEMQIARSVNRPRLGERGVDCIGLRKLSPF